MQIDGLNEEEQLGEDDRAASVLGGTVVAQPTVDAATVDAAMVDAARNTAVVDGAPKICCICGLDISQKKRLRDRSGRHWCQTCNAFESNADKASGTTPCPSCSREIRPMLMVELAGEKVCKPCHAGYLAECERKEQYKTTVTTNPETEIRALIRRLVNCLFALAGFGVLVTLYHFNLLYFHPPQWVPFVGALYFAAGVAVIVLGAIGVQYGRIAMRKTARRAEYDKTIREAVNHVLALDEESHSMGVSESPEVLRRRVERAVLRVESCGGGGDAEAGKVIDALAKHTGTNKQEGAARLVKYLMAQRPSTEDTVGRNREIATISLLELDLDTANQTVTAILLRLRHDQDAMTRHALICYRRGAYEDAKKVFKKVVHIARERNSETDLAAAFRNLGMLHMMLSEWDDASVRYSQALKLYMKLGAEDGQADSLLNMGVVAFRQKKWAEVEDPIRKALAINRRRKRVEGMAICCSLLGMVLNEKEPPQLAEAKKLLDEAVSLNMELGRPGNVAAAYGNLGLVCAKREDFKGANDFLRKALDIYQRINRPKMTMKIQGMLKTVASLKAAQAAQSR